MQIVFINPSLNAFISKDIAEYYVILIFLQKPDWMGSKRIGYNSNYRDLKFKLFKDIIHWFD